MNYDQAGQPSPMLFGRYLRFPPRTPKRRIYNTAIVEIREITVFGTIIRCTTSGKTIIRSGRRRLRPHERSIRNGPTSVEETESSGRIAPTSHGYMVVTETCTYFSNRAVRRHTKPYTGWFDRLGSKPSRCPSVKIESQKTSYNRIFQREIGAF